MSKLFVNKNDLFTPTPRKIRGLKEVGNHVVLKILGYQTCRFDVVFGKKSCRTEKNLLVTLSHTHKIEVETGGFVQRTFYEIVV